MTGIEPHISRYFKFIQTRNPPNHLKSPTQGFERHHIIPRALGGSDAPENIIKLTSREHFIAHLILWKACGGNMAYAIWYMSQKQPQRLTARQYEALKKDQAERSSILNKGRFTGSKNPMFGKTHSESWKEELRKRNSGEGNPNFGKSGNLGSSWKWTEEQKAALRQRRKQQKAYNHDTCSGRKWMINRETLHQCVVRPSDFEEYKSKGYEFGRIEPLKPKRKKI